MRIWYQSSVAIGTNPAFKSYEDAIRQNADTAVRPGTQVDIHGVGQMNPQFQKTALGHYFNNIPIIQNGIRAEAEGYDVMAVGCYYDPGLRELRDTLGIPVVFIMQLSMHMACMLGDRFALVGYSPMNLKRVVALAERYRLDHRLAGAECFEADLAKADKWFTDPATLLEGFHQAARASIAKGADALIPACGILNQVLRLNGVRTVDGCPIIDGGTLLLKTAEMMAELHKLTTITTQNRNVTRELVQAIQSNYGIK